MPAILSCHAWRPGSNGDPDEAEAADDEREEAAERTHDGGGPVDLATVGAHDFQVAHDAADGRAFQFPHDGAVDGEGDELQLGVMIQRAEHHADDDRVDEQREDANPEAGAREAEGVG